MTITDLSCIADTSKADLNKGNKSEIQIINNIDYINYDDEYNSEGYNIQNNKDKGDKITNKVNVKQNNNKNVNNEGNDTSDVYESADFLADSSLLAKE